MRTIYLSRLDDSFGKDTTFARVFPISPQFIPRHITVKPGKCDVSFFFVYPHIKDGEVFHEKKTTEKPFPGCTVSRSARIESITLPMKKFHRHLDNLYKWLADQEVSDNDHNVRVHAGIMLYFLKYAEQSLFCPPQ